MFSYHDQVDKGHCVKADAPQPHDAKHVDQDHGDRDGDHHSWPHLKAQQHRGHHKYGTEWDAQVQSRVVDNGEVLIKKHVEDAKNEHNLN